MNKGEWLGSAPDIDIQDNLFRVNETPLPIPG